MSELSTLEQVVLFSLGTPDEEVGANLGSLLAALEGEYQETRRDYYIAGLALPSQAELRDILQRLRDGGYLDATGCEICGVTTVGNIRDPDIDEWETDLVATPSGLEAASDFRRLIQSDDGRKMTAEFVRRYIDEQRVSLPFELVVPSWMLADDSFLIGLEVGDDDPFMLRYRRGADTFAILQTNGDLPTTLVAETEPSLIRAERLVGVDIEIHEYQLTSIWARLTARWDRRGISFLVIIERNHDIGQYPEWMPASIDDLLRQEARMVARSIIGQVDN